MESSIKYEIFLLKKKVTSESTVHCITSKYILICVSGELTFTVTYKDILSLLSVIHKSKL